MTGDRRFAGMDRLHGLVGARQIRDAHVAVVGIGGVGSWAVESLARSGVGQLTLIDLDHVAESNINRQIQATVTTLGQAKVIAMRDRVHTYFPECRITCIEEFVDASNWPGLLPAGISAVIDACDQVNAKLAMCAWAVQTSATSATSATFVTVGAAGGKTKAHLADVGDLAEVTHDPLLSKLRYRLRKEGASPRDGKKIGITCVFSREQVAPPDATCGLSTNDGTLNCHGFGSQVSVTATFGHCAAGYVLNQLARASQVQTG